MPALHYFDQLVGIIGGTGPEATNYFTSLLVKQRGQVKKDQDHIPFLLFNNPQIPDRSKYLLYGGENPLPDMIRTGLTLKKAGATFLVVPCNTAHVFVNELEKVVRLPVMSLIDVTAEYISSKYGRNTKVGLLATNGTIKSNIYQNAFSRISTDISVIVPDQKTQKDVMKGIYEIKKFSVDEHNFSLLYSAARKLIQQGASVIILGCTEIPLALTQESCNFKRIDPMEILAKKVIEKTLKSKSNIYSKFPGLSQLRQY